MRRPRKNWLEWGIFGLSLLVIFSTIGALIYEKVTLAGTPADPQMTVGTPAVHGDYFAVPVTVTNRGDETAQGVRLEVTLLLPSGETEDGSFQLHYLPRHATRKGWITFRHDPRQGKLAPRVLGYENP